MSPLKNIIKESLYFSIKYEISLGIINKAINAPIANGAKMVRFNKEIASITVV